MKKTFRRSGYRHARQGALSARHVRGNWRKEDLSSAIILQKCCHDLDIMLAICNEEIENKMSEDCVSEYRHGFAAYQLKNGSVVRLMYAGAAGEKREYCCIYGTLGEIRLDLHRETAWFFKQEPNYKGDEIKPTLTADDFLAVQLKNAVQNGKNAVFLSVDAGLLDL